jgi:hypothetical protein
MQHKKVSDRIANMEVAMNRMRITTWLLVVLGLGIATALANAATILNTPASPPTVQKTPPALRDRLNAVLPPVFLIGNIVFSNAKFQNCAAPAGFRGVLQGGTLQNWNWEDQFCWLANVSVSHTGQLANATGKNLQLLATTVVVTGAQPLSVTSLYELPLQPKNAVTFTFVAASGYVPRPAYPSNDPRYKPPTPDFLYTYFSRPYGIILQVEYDGAIQGTLSCRYFLSEMDNCKRQ